MFFFKKKNKTQNKKGKTSFPLKIYGTSGLPQIEKGVPTSLEFMDELAPPDGLEKYYKMKVNDPIVGVLLLELSRIIQGLRYKVEGANAGFIQEMLENLRFRRFLGEVTDVFCYGFYLGEKVYGVDGKNIVITDIEPRFPPSIYKINDANGNVEQQTIEGTFYIPFSKCVHFTIASECRDYFGTSILRHIYKAYYYKISIEAVEATSIDRDLAGIPVMTTPEGFDWSRADPDSPNYDPDVAATLEWAKTLVVDVRKDNQQGVVKPYGWEFELLKGDNRTSVPTNDIISRYNTEMTVGLLQAFLSLGSFASTNNANVELTLQNFLTVCDTFALQIAEMINTQIIKPICRINRKTSPVLSFEKLDKSQLKALINMLTSLVEKQIIVPDDKLGTQMEKMLNL